MYQEKIRHLYIRIAEGKIDYTKVAYNGQVKVDFDMDGNALGFEFIDPLNVEVNGEAYNV